MGDDAVGGDAFEGANAYEVVLFEGFDGDGGEGVVWENFFGGFGDECFEVSEGSFGAFHGEVFAGGAEAEEEEEECAFDGVSDCCGACGCDEHKDVDVDAFFAECFECAAGGSEACEWEAECSGEPEEPEWAFAEVCEPCDGDEEATGGDDGDFVPRVVARRGVRGFDGVCGVVSGCGGHDGCVGELVDGSRCGCVWLIG